MLGNIVIQRPEDGGTGFQTYRLIHEVTHGCPLKHVIQTEISHTITYNHEVTDIGLTFRDMGMPRDAYKGRHPDIYIDR